MSYPSHEGGGSCLAAAGKGLEWLPADVVVISEPTVTPPVRTKPSPKPGAGRAAQVPAGAHGLITASVSSFISRNPNSPSPVQVWPHRDKPIPVHGKGWAGLGDVGWEKPGKWA